MINHETGLDSEPDEDDYKGTVQSLLHMSDCMIRDVWADNFEEEVKNMMKLCEKFPVIAMDTEFPGVCVSRTSSQYSEEESEYQHVRRNIEETKLIQIGFTIADEHGNVPEPICTWQYNFRFDIRHDKIVNQAEELLNKAGIKFDKLISNGIEFRDFAQFFVASGVVFSKEIKWVVFHGSYDFAYLLRLMKGEELPMAIDEFYKEIKLYFPIIYDLKYIIKDLPNLKEVGLNRLSERIGCSRIGPQHQAGSDSLLTLCCYFRMFDKEETSEVMRKKSLINVIFGVGVGLILTGQSYPVRETRGDYLENNYNDYYDGRNYMMNYGMNGMNSNGMNSNGMNTNGMTVNNMNTNGMHANGMGQNVPHNINPLYQYLQTHPQQNYMYNNPHRQY